ncbi:hypothetical protein Glove_212g73 [Diversispora epigaea]|uniref:Uncharacterized protein n=1 Tax=Diversispora epigaea TaxID=1348612 RepID=A0A397IPC1_9GLOM|nr:hypothetical protein Glove_212g73 [Diversispora epigaea]
MAFPKRTSPLILSGYLPVVAFNNENLYTIGGEWSKWQLWKKIKENNENDNHGKVKISFEFILTHLFNKAEKLVLSESNSNGIRC